MAGVGKLSLSELDHILQPATAAMGAPILFSTIEVTRQVFYRSSLSYAIVNLKPIVPGHVLVIPNRPVSRLTELTTPELTSLITSVKDVGSVIERVYSGDALTVACQDGKAAGQSIPHVHFHILPRKFKGDFFSGRNDDIYPALEEAEESLPRDLQSVEQVKHSRLRVDADDKRETRTMDDMEKEAIWLRTFFKERDSAA